jgi:hypothetical protein
VCSDQLTQPEPSRRSQSQRRKPPAPNDRSPLDVTTLSARRLAGLSFTEIDDLDDERAHSIERSVRIQHGLGSLPVSDFPY